MIKNIKIGDKDYILKSSAYTIFAYKDETGRDLLSDITSINENYIKLNKKVKDEGLTEEEKGILWINEVTPIMEHTLKIAHIMIKEVDKNFKEYNEWLRDIENLFENAEWVMEVLEVAIAPFCGKLQTNK